MEFRSNKVEAEYRKNLLRPGLRDVILTVEILAQCYGMAEGIEINEVVSPTEIAIMTENWTSKFKQRMVTVLVVFRQLSKGKIQHEFIDELLHIELTEV